MSLDGGETKSWKWRNRLHSNGKKGNERPAPNTAAEKAGAERLESACRAAEIKVKKMMTEEEEKNAKETAERRRRLRACMRKSRQKESVIWTKPQSGS